MTGSGFHDLAEVGVLRISGADARAFLQAQLTADVASLAPGAGELAAWCSPQGRVIALLRVATVPDGFLALLPRTLARPVAERMVRFVMRAKVAVADASGDLGAAGLSADGPGSVAPPADLPRAVTMIRLPAARALLVGPTADLATVGSTLPRSPAGAWETLAVKLGEPEVYPATSESWIPQMLNLDLLGAVSFRKGCYPGQEIVARTQHLGRIKRRLFRYHVTGPAVPAPGTALLSGQARVGEVVRVAGVEGRAELLAVVALESRGLGLVAEDGGATCTPEPLPYAVPEAAAAT